MPWEIVIGQTNLSACGIRCVRAGTANLPQDLTNVGIADSQSTGNVAQRPIERPELAGRKARGREEVRINPTDAFAKEAVLIE